TTAGQNEGKINVVERTRGPRAKPQVPVKAGRNGVRLVRPIDSLRPEGPAGPVLHPAHRSDGASPDPFAEQPRRLRGRVAHGHLGRDLARSGHARHPPGLIDRVRHRLLAVGMLSHLHGHDGDGRVPVVGGTDYHTVYALTLAHQLAEVAVGRTARVTAGGLVLAVVGLDDLPCRVASGRGARQLAPPARVFQQGADLVAKLVRAPFRVVAALAIDVRDGHHLH